MFDKAIPRLPRTRRVVVPELKEPPSLEILPYHGTFLIDWPNNCVYLNVRNEIVKFVPEKRTG